jgi:hypothetical protein
MVHRVKVTWMEQGNFPEGRRLSHTAPIIPRPAFGAVSGEVYVRLEPGQDLGRQRFESTAFLLMCTCTNFGCIAQ